MKTLNAFLCTVALAAAPLLLPSAVQAEEYAAAADEAARYTQAELDQMLAPVALYPDAVLTHVLIASTYPVQVVRAARWSADHGLEGEAAVAAVADRDWDDSVKALVAFPELLARMDDDVQWTERLGDAFLSQEAVVLDTVQSLRTRAYNAGNLKTTEQVRVVREPETIIIEPAVREVVYVPVYDTRVVYGPWWWSAHPPVHWTWPGRYYGATGYYWGPGVYVTPAFYHSRFHWHSHHIIVHDHRWRHQPRYHRPRGHGGRPPIKPPHRVTAERRDSPVRAPAIRERRAATTSRAASSRAAPARPAVQTRSSARNASTDGRAATAPTRSATSRVTAPSRSATTNRGTASRSVAPSRSQAPTRSSAQAGSRSATTRSAAPSRSAATSAPARAAPTRSTPATPRAAPASRAPAASAPSRSAAPRQQSRSSSRER